MQEDSLLETTGSEQKNAKIPVHESVPREVTVGLSFLLECLRVGESETLLHLRLLSYSELKKLLEDMEALVSFVNEIALLLNAIHELDDREVTELDKYEDPDATHALNFLLQAIRSGPALMVQTAARLDKADRQNLILCFDEFYKATQDMQNVVFEAYSETKEPWLVN